MPEHLRNIPRLEFQGWEEGIGSDGETIKSKAQLEKDFEGDEEIICHCHLGIKHLTIYN
ncbi:MAG: hypothetical protein WAM14_19415 [Candidatus Nitrosopolaris sp.]